MKPGEQKVVKIESPFTDKISSLAINKLLDKLTLSMPRGTDGSFQPVPSMTIVLFIVTALPCQVGL